MAENPQPEGQKKAKILSVKISPIIQLLISLIALIFPIGLWIGIYKNKIDNLLETQIPDINTSVRTLQNSISEINRDVANITNDLNQSKVQGLGDESNESIQVLSNRVSTLEALNIPTYIPFPTPFQVPIAWSGYERFENRINFDKDGTGFTLEVKQKDVNQYFYLYIPVENIKSLSFDLKINEMAYLGKSQGPIEDEKNNYRILIGVSEQGIIEKEAIKDMFVEARIYPTLRTTNEGLDYWICCAIKTVKESPPDFSFIVELTEIIPSIKMNENSSWEITIDDNGKMNISVDNTNITQEPFELDKFSKPVFYVGYRQSPLCAGSCPVAFELFNFEMITR